MSLWILEPNMLETFTSASIFVHTAATRPISKGAHGDYHRMVCLMNPCRSA